MSDERFAAVRRQVLALHAVGDYAAALKVARRAAAEHPEAADRTTYWIACLQARLGDADVALATLEGGAERGMWWPPDALEADPDLESIRGEDRFRTIVEAGRRARAEAAARPYRHPIVRTHGDPEAALIVLHARGMLADDLIGPWSTASDVVFVAPQSTQPFDMRSDCWDDAGKGEADVRAAVEQALADADGAGLPLVLGGYSQGAALALILSTKQPWQHLRGCIAVAPSARWATDVIGERPPEMAGLRFAIFAGRLDPLFDDCLRLAEQLASSGAETRVDRIDDLGHDYPADFSQRLPTMLDWVLRRHAERPGEVST